MDARTEEIRARVSLSEVIRNTRQSIESMIPDVPHKALACSMLTQLDWICDAELTALREEVERLKGLVTDKEPNGYPLWFNRAVHDCNDCDSEDLCARHWKMADSDFANCESEVAAFLAALSPSPAQQEGK